MTNSGSIYRQNVSNKKVHPRVAGQQKIIFDPKNRRSAERNERSERIRGCYANAATHQPGEWRLPQNFFSFGIFRFFRPSNCRIKVD